MRIEPWVVVNVGTPSLFIENGQQVISEENLIIPTLRPNTVIEGIVLTKFSK